MCQQNNTPYNIIQSIRIIIYVEKEHMYGKIYVEKSIYVDKFSRKVGALACNASNLGPSLNMKMIFVNYKVTHFHLFMCLDLQIAKQIECNSSTNLTNKQDLSSKITTETMHILEMSQCLSASDETARYEWCIIGFKSTKSCDNTCFRYEKACSHSSIHPNKTSFQTSL
jgi:hypothetical protein